MTTLLPFWEAWDAEGGKEVLAAVGVASGRREQEEEQGGQEHEEQAG